MWWWPNDLTERPGVAIVCIAAAAAAGALLALALGFGLSEVVDWLAASR
ncbi:MAG TPA: hypothetical protein PLL30_17010 [Candidatus Krumholzibacteria bacterium]|nr:hypothetical protein [Candidatus Krumholzibacteria bacterium]HPD73475.1 hypothetical protein [Candidatus Krumholzibacteria bacterium]HRY42198.1 hypothetical protein [Candidatus Krumholzibacteria bacterium]